MQPLLHPRARKVICPRAWHPSEGVHTGSLAEFYLSRRRRARSAWTAFVGRDALLALLGSRKNQDLSETSNSCCRKSVLARETPSVAQAPRSRPLAGIFPL